MLRLEILFRGRRKLRDLLDFDKEASADNQASEAALEPSKGTSNRAQTSLNRLLAWLETSPEVTCDPNDFKAHPVFGSQDYFAAQTVFKVHPQDCIRSFCLST